MPEPKHILRAKDAGQEAALLGAEPSWQQAIVALAEIREIPERITGISLMTLCWLHVEAEHINDESLTEQTPMV